VKEIHLTRPGWEGILRVDLHQPIKSEALDLLGWVLARTPDPWVTLEVEESPEETPAAQLFLLRHFLAAR
jgi:hypothetical protein